MKTARRGVLYITAGCIAAGPLLVWFLSHPPAAVPAPVNVPVTLAAAGTVTTLPRSQAAQAGSLLDLARRDPTGLARLGHERYHQQVRDYRCVLLKQERIDGQLSPVQEIEIRFRKQPPSVYMLWRKNADGARRALFCPEHPAFRDEQGNLLARVEPNGPIVRLFVRDVFMPIYGEHARKQSRRTIDECGFGPSFELLEHYNGLAEQNGVLDFRFGGVGTVDGRPTFVLIRHLPYRGDDGPYPDATLILHLDQEWLLPVALESFADHDGRQLLGRYVFTKVELNCGLTDADFAF